MTLHLALITGMSGSGKSVALRALEDVGYYCVDNLPPALLAQLVALQRDHPQQRQASARTTDGVGTRAEPPPPNGPPQEALRAHVQARGPAADQANDPESTAAGGVPPTQPRPERLLAVAMDVRSSGDLSGLPEQLRTLTLNGVHVASVFLDSDTDTLVRRFSETRRRHPLSADATDQRTALQDAIAMERHLLANLRAHAHVIDTSIIRPSQLQSYVQAFINAPTEGLMLVFETFGFKRGLPIDADYVFDVRMLPNPFYEPELRALTGRDEPVQRFLRGSADVCDMLDDISAFLARWLGPMVRDHRSYVTVAIGCTGGQHRSVYLAEQLAAHFRGQHSVLVRHRELDAHPHQANH